MNPKHFTPFMLQRHPLFCKDNGELRLINMYFEDMEWEPITKEQHRAIAGLIRYRNNFLQNNPQLDKRVKYKSTKPKKRG